MYTLAQKIARQRRAKRLRGVLTKLRLAYYEFEGTVRFPKYEKLVANIVRQLKRLK